MITAQMRGRETHNQEVELSNPEHLISFIFLAQFLLHNIGYWIETVAALLVSSVSKITSGRGADVRTCYT